ncbi:DEKNAAC100632 [Brettanomyces naardenensis]|uniref:DEKNAAC100632 n=1 Tax=Brettanomyces naardenensis TaxID=13370 RepID=A0A448YGK7_BRENA|nr:DEKNAAC100632 [Brettanomyces naardenensis]
MLDSVQQIAPGLTIAQIRYDLERTGDVNLTVDRYLNEGNLPFPPGYREQQILTENDDHQEIAAEKATATVSGAEENAGSVEIPKGPFGGLSFEAKRKELVMEGRKKMIESTEMTWEEITKRYGFA